MQIDAEQMKLMKELLSPVQPVQAQRQDSFSSFTGGLRENWIFLVALFSGFMFLVTSQYDNKNIDQFQATQIESSIEDIEQNRVDIQQNSKNIQTLNDTQVSTYNDVIIRLNALQASLDTLKVQHD